MAILTLSVSCKKNNPDKQIDVRTFKMGFSTWSYGHEDADKIETYSFINNHADIRSVQMDDKIPWNAWINNSALPIDYVDDVNYRVGNLNPNQDLVLSISPLNTDRSDLIEDWETGNTPSFSSFSDLSIVHALIDHSKYLIDNFQPEYLVISMEGNDLLINAPDKWTEYRNLMTQVRDSIKILFPTLRISESVTLHNWYDSKESISEEYFQTVKDLISQQDFASISFYPFFVGMKNHKGYQKAFDFLHSNVSIPITFTETNQLAEDLEVEAYDIDIKGNEKIQNNYLESLFINAHKHNYEFVIWWSYRDYDKLWETFPENLKDVGKLWRDTGLLDGDGEGRKSFDTWKEIYQK